MGYIALVLLWMAEIILFGFLLGISVYIGFMVADKIINHF